MCSRHAATGSGSSRRTAVATASQSRSTSGSPKTTVAQPSFGNATIDQLQSAVGEPQARLGDLAHARAADAAAVEVGEELGLGVAGDREQRAALGAEVVEPLHEPRRREAELRPRRRARCARGGRAGRCRARRRSSRPPRTPRCATARTSGSCSTSALIPSSWPGCRLTPTWTASRAYSRNLSSAAVIRRTIYFPGGRLLERLPRAQASPYTHLADARA